MILGLVITVLGLICLSAATLAVGSLLEILTSGSGIGCIFREKNREAAVFLSSISVIAVCASYLAFTDILKDYAGYMLFLPDGQSVHSILPYWAKCTSEWSWVRLGGLVIACSQLAMVGIMMKSRAIQSDLPKLDGVEFR